MSSSGSLSQPLISPSIPFVDPRTGILTPTGLRFLLTLQTRTGGSQGYDLAVIAAEAAGALQSAENLADLSDLSTAQTNLGLKSAAFHPTTDFATAAQGALAGSALQPNTDISVSTVQIEGVQVVGPQETGWTASTGTAVRTGLDGTWTQSIGASYSQTEVQGLETQTVLLTQTLVALLNNLATYGAIGP